MPDSQIDVKASPHLWMDDWNIPTQVRKRLSRTQADLSRPMPSGLALEGLRDVAVIDLQSTSRPIYSQFTVQHECSVEIIH